MTARYGGALLWLATLSILTQGLYNIEISRYTLYTGEPIFTGKFRTPPGPRFWLGVYLILDFGSVFPYLAATAATPVMILLLGGRMPDPDSVPLHWWMHKFTATGIFAASVIPLIFGGKVYNSLKAVMSLKLVTVFGFLLIVALLYSSPSTWFDIGSGFFKFGTVPVLSGEDRNGNGRLDPGEDWDGDGHLDVVEQRLEPTVDSDGDGRPDTWERGPRGQLVKHQDLDGDGYPDGPNVENLFVSWFSRGVLPTVDFTLIAFIAAMAAIAGNGGLSNTPISNFTREQGWGMGHHVGAIPSMVGGQGITLSHVGSVFEVNRQSLPRWRRWYRHVVRDQCVIWIPTCFIGLALPSMLSVEFLRRGTEADRWNAAALTAEGVGRQVANPPDGVLASMTGSPRSWAAAPGGIFSGLRRSFAGFWCWLPAWSDTSTGWFAVGWIPFGPPAPDSGRWTRPGSAGFTSADHGLLRFGSDHALAERADGADQVRHHQLQFRAGHQLLPYIDPQHGPASTELRPGWFIRIAMVLGGIFFFLLGLAATLRELGII